ncbi:MAG: acetyl-CoA carboxylase biotin carboxyl carrier protein [Oligosphaeraceae bacterium]|nr:acetyl-CoA carboxylase biotin carboxyl carrier protein [Oligosphaeraceae bacterium]
MDTRIVAKLAEIMTQHQLTELEIAQENFSVRLCRGQSREFIDHAVQQKLPAAVATEVSAVVPEVKTICITAPMPGTFYSASAPEAAPFLKEGDDVSLGKVVCIVEAMKVMNEVKAEVCGKVSKILVQNGTPVEFGQPLFELIAP